jgi:hypothetical protein
VRKNFLDFFHTENEEIRKAYLPEKETLFTPLMENHLQMIPPLTEKNKAEIALLGIFDNHVLLKDFASFLEGF